MGNSQVARLLQTTEVTYEQGGYRAASGSQDGVAEDSVLERDAGPHFS